MAAAPDGTLHGRVAVITGASRGIGLAVARRIAGEGAHVVLTARHADALADAVASLPAGSATGIAGRADDVGHRATVFERVAAEHGRIDMLVNNAGINPVFGPLAGLDLDAARKVVEVNVIGTLAWTQQALLAGLGEAPAGGSVVNLSSVTGIVPSPGLGWYGVSKAAVAHLSSTLAVELAPRVRVNAVAPAVVTTQFAEALYEGREQEVAARYPLGRLGTPADVASAVLFLCSDEAAWITGQVLTLDGGLLNAGGTA